VESYLVGLASRHPGLVRLEKLEQTHEGRSVLAVRIGNSTLGKEISKKSQKSLIYFRFTQCVVQLVHRIVFIPHGPIHKLVG
jgi:hypothetical protein